MNRIAGKLPELVKEAVGNIDSNAEIILFGSRARGDNRIDSDWDFLILLSIDDSETVKRSIRDKLFELELATDEIISSLIESKKNWSDFKITPLYKNVETEGITIS